MNATNQQTTYWLSRLADPPPPPNLPWDKERPPVASFLRETTTTKLGSELWHGVKRLAARADTTLDVVLLAALKTLLFRYSGQTDLVVGTVLGAGSGPARRQLVALRTRLAGHSTARNLVVQIAATVREAGRRLEVPLDAVLELLQPGAHEGGLFNVALIFHEPDSNPADFSCPLESFGADHLMNYSLVLQAHEAGDCLELTCDYDAELFERATVERLAGHLGNLLAGMAAEPDSTLERLNLLGAAELRQLLVEWNATQAEIPIATGIHQLIEAQARKTPQAIAAICRDRQLTYAELNARANQVASRLCRLGVGPDVLVGLCAERSLEMLVGLLGILKSGGAYLPLDPAYPAERLGYMIEDARVKVLLTQERLMSSLPPGRTPRVRLDADWPLIASEPADNVDRRVSPHHLAYVIYTSGSTGRPKGVMVEHGNVLNFFAGMDARIQHGSGS
ncbi:MAG: AMP-binding protein, partial [Verrucomicrobiota bacterium]|nr:AMP-binding protein [Verrucomicrobiota bacterium]